MKKGIFTNLVVLVEVELEATGEEELEEGEVEHWLWVLWQHTERREL